MHTPSSRPCRWAPPGVLLLLLLAPLAALARSGGGEHYTLPSPEGGGGDGISLEPLFLLLRLTVRYPHLMLPLLGLGAVGYFVWQRRLGATGSTQRALQQREAEARTQVSSRDVQGWVNALQLKDPAFELLPLLDRTRWLFVQLQEAWFRRELGPVRPFLSDATYQRLGVQLQLLASQGVRDALTDVQVLEVQIIGLSQSAWFDSVQLRVRAQMRDTDVPAGMSDEAARAAARRVPEQSFTEVWTFVRRPGAPTRLGQDLYQGKCPNCGAPYKGGATNVCEYCNAVVNSGNYDWTLSEITQG
ncbi:MAG TPA: Tim44-like domain-containing protein, partial [Aggregicoccus sp.]|nr:Tim44-like domain-containing protein [Aggregicoccus sp.]